MCQLLGKVINHSLTRGEGWEGGQGEKGWGGWCPPVEPARETEVLKAHNMWERDFPAVTCLSDTPCEALLSF